MKNMAWTIAVAILVLGLHVQTSCCTPFHRRLHTCLNDDVCSCKNRVAECACNVGVSAIIDVAMITLTADVDSFIIRGHECDVVLHPTAFAHMPLKSVEISGVANVDIRMAAFFKVSNTESILISDTTVHVRPFAFNAMSNVTWVEFRNVTIGNVSHQAFNEVSHIGTFTIVNSRIAMVHENAFTNTSDIGHFVIVNTSIDNLNAGSIKMSRVSQVTLDNVTVATWHSGAIEVHKADLLEVKSSTIQSLPERALVGRNLSRFHFKNNMVSELRRKAFAGLEHVNSVLVSGNYLDDVEEDYSLISGNSWVIEGNTLNCEANNMCWLFDSDVARAANTSRFYRSNFCQNTAWTTVTNTSLDNLLSFLDDEDVCSNDGESSGDGEHKGHDADISSRSSRKSASSPFLSSIAFLLIVLRNAIVNISQ